MSCADLCVCVICVHTPAAHPLTTNPPEPHFPCPPPSPGWKFLFTWWWVQSTLCQVKVNALGPKPLMQAQIVLLEQVKPCSCSALVTHSQRVKAGPALGECCSCFPASASSVLGSSPKMPKHTDPAFTSGPKLSPASAGPTAIRYEVSVRAHPHLGTSGHSTKSFQPAGPSPAAPPCATAAQLRREMPAPSTLSGKAE